MVHVIQGHMGCPEEPQLVKGAAVEQQLRAAQRLATGGKPLAVEAAALEALRIRWLMQADVEPERH